MKTTKTGNAIPKQTSGMCTANESACSCLASNRYAWSEVPNADGAVAAVAASRGCVTARTRSDR